MSGTLVATPDRHIAALTLAGLVALLGPWWVQAGWLVAVALLEAWHQLDRVADHAHEDGW